MDQSLYMTIDKFDCIDKLVQEIKQNLNDRLITEMKYIIREYNKEKKNNKNVGKISKISKIDKNYTRPSLVVDFN